MAYLIRAAMLMVCLSVPAYLIVANLALFEPYLLPLRVLKANVETVDENVVVGPYADPEDLATLKGAGVTTVVSLLDPSIVYERSLLEREAAEVPGAGLQFVNVPLHRSEAPYSQDNRTSVRHLDLLLSTPPQGKIYVHGFLDAPRALVARELLRSHRRVASAS
jgi:hypothetical protein